MKIEKHKGQRFYFKALYVYVCSCINGKRIDYFPYLILDYFDEKQNVTDTSAEKSHLFAAAQKGISRRL